VALGVGVRVLVEIGTDVTVLVELGTRVTVRVELGMGSTVPVELEIGVTVRVELGMGSTVLVELGMGVRLTDVWVGVAALPPPVSTISCGALAPDSRLAKLTALAACTLSARL
jgi:hypothetical protein